MSGSAAATLPATDQPVSGHTARRLETHRKLLEAGTALFAERGVPAVTSTEIARRAGVATGTFYLHFDDKHALFEALVDEVMAEIRAKYHADRSAPRSEAERRAEIEGMLEVVERRRDLVRAVFERGEDSGLAERVHNQIADGLAPAYARLFHERGISLHPGAAAQARAATMVRIIAWWAEDLARATRSDVVDILLELDPLRLSGGLDPPRET